MVHSNKKNYLVILKWNLLSYHPTRYKWLSNYLVYIDQVITQSFLLPSL